MNAPHKSVEVFGYAASFSVCVNIQKDSYLIQGMTPAGPTSQGFCQNREN